jgi:hypothetical protein
VSSDDAIVFVDENWICESKLLDAFCDLVYLLFSMRPTVFIVRDELRNFDSLNHDRTPDKKKAPTRLTGSG